MAASVQILLSEYLHTSYRPDREFVDGELVERNVGKFEHARVQFLLALWFGRHERDWNIVGLTEQRVQVSQVKVRIPDLVLICAGSAPDVLIDPPLLVVEILSPDDTYFDVHARASEYLAMGIENVWLVDPSTRTAKVCHKEAWAETRRPEIAGTDIHVEIARLFEDLDASRRI